MHKTMITLTREEAQQVLSVLDDLSPQHGRPDDVEESIETLRARLNEPKPEPVGWIYEDDEGRMMFSQMPKHPPLWEPVYRTAPKEKSDSKQTLQLALDALVKWQGICLAKSRSANELTIPTKAIFALTAALAQGDPK